MPAAALVCIRRQLGLTRTVSHGANAAWFRVRARVKVDDWSDDPAWQARVPTRRALAEYQPPDGQGLLDVVDTARLRQHQHRHRRRRRSAPVLRASTATSGLSNGCANSNRSARGWSRGSRGPTRGLSRAEALRARLRAGVLARSAGRWSGEAGVFTDPFYSPGSDFIAIGNDFTADLITRAAAGEDVVGPRRGVQRQLPAALRRVPAALRRAVPADGQRPGDDRQGRLGQRLLLGDHARCSTSSAAIRDPAFMASIEPLLRRFFVLHARMQQLFRAWDLADTRSTRTASPT